MGLFSAITGLFGASGNRKAIQKAADAANAKSQQAIDLTQQQNTANTAAYQPYTAAGGQATTSIANLLGLNGNDASSSAIEALKASPLFQSRYDTGANTILQNASATGGLRGGNTQSSLAQFGSGLLGDVEQNQIANLLGLSNQGLNATSNLSNTNSNNTSNIANLLTGQGQTTASAILGKHQATQAGINGVAGYLDNNMQQIGNVLSGNFGASGGNTGTIASLLQGFKF